MACLRRKWSRAIIVISMDKKTDSTIDTVRRILSNRRKKSVDDPSLMPAAVLLLMYPKDGQHHILLNKRTDEVEHHKGEISFPGGGRDPEDRDFLDTALRENHEEMGIKPEDVMILGELDDVITRSNFGVRVFVGSIPYPYYFRPSPEEIAEVLEVPVRELLDPGNRMVEARWEGGRVSTTYCYATGGHMITGATAQILTQFLELYPDGSGVMREGS